MPLKIKLNNKALNVTHAKFGQSRHAGWSLGWVVSAVDVQGRTIWIVDTHGYGKRFIVSADEIPTALVELKRAIHEFAMSLIS